MAEPTGFEPATSDVTGRRSNQLNYDSAGKPEFSISNLKPEIPGSQKAPDAKSKISNLRLVGTEGLEPPTSSL